ncbi:flavin-containing monooxygenase [Nocardia vaccinii]|uniref:flavin-containing monooxygenase n=1 Tax=Nocardia vaccinii TaxID=1822 RepID=UPI000B0A0203|nr:NAD(P)/FAD-dependent oxidoreductase [Nocardia vaccinii]
MIPANRTDDLLSEAIAEANIPTLLLVLTQLSGELRWIEPPFTPTRPRGLSDNDSAGLSTALQETVRAEALRAIRDWRGGKPVAMPNPDVELLVRMLSVSLGEPLPTEYGPLVADALATTDLSDDAVVGPPPGFRAIVMGAGMSGIAAAVRLAQANVPYTILERNDEVGGTWMENRYPGCGVDVPSHLYSYTFADREWTHYFAMRDELFAYFNGVADDFGLRENIRFNTEVVSAHFDEDSQEWVVQARGSDDTLETYRANLLISAVGVFNKPRLPNVPGIDGFTGNSVHTARWPIEDIDLDGRRVAVVGNAASAMQVVPAIADRVADLTIFQRSPQWVTPFEKLHEPIPDAINYLMAEVPLYRLWYRLRLGWAFNDRLHPALQKDPDWPHPERAVNSINDRHRLGLTRYIEAELGDRLDLLPDVLPDYPPFGKRILLDNGWYRTIRRPNVHLLTESVTEVTRDGVVGSVSGQHDVDVIIWATGFDVVHFVAPIEVIGTSGTKLSETWNEDDARAYLGTAVPGFPNFFCLYGPNTQFGHGGSLTSVIERQLHYIMDVLDKLWASGARSIEVRPEVYEDYGRRIDDAHERMIWTHEGMQTYYRNSKGRVVVPNPFRIMDMWEWTKEANLNDYELHR